MSCTNDCPNCEELERRAAFDKSVWSEKLWRERQAAIFALVEKTYHVSESVLCRKVRTSHVAAARHVASYLFRRLTGYSFPRIGELMRRDHSTVIHSYNLIAKEMATCAPKKAAIEKLVRQIEAYDLASPSAQVAA